MPVHHHLGVSAFAEYATVSRRSLVKIDHNVPLEHAALFGCAVLTGVGAVVNTARVTAGSTVAVVGLGGVGLAALLGAIAAGAERIVAIDLSPQKLALAKQLGATDGFEANAGCHGQDPRSDTWRRRFRARNGRLCQGTRACVPYHPARRNDGDGRAAATERDAQVPAVNLVAEERTLKGSYIGTSVPSRDYRAILGCSSAGGCRSTVYCTDRLRLDQINEGFDRLHDGTAIRQVVTL